MERGRKRRGRRKKKSRRIMRASNFNFRERDIASRVSGLIKFVWRSSKMAGEKAPWHSLRRRRRATGRCHPSPSHASPRHYIYIRHPYPVTRSIRSTFAKTTRTRASGKRAFSLSCRDFAR